MKSGPAFTMTTKIAPTYIPHPRTLFISKKLRSGRDAVSGLLAIDFDSVEFAISAVDRKPASPCPQ
jgi:hypothetical protein